MINVSLSYKKLNVIFPLLLIAAAIAAGVFLGIAQYQNQRASKNQRTGLCSGCNVILISVDTLGAKHLGLYGYGKPTSPFLDKLAKERGIVFENAISHSSWTLPSHAAMLTGRYPAEINVWKAIDALPPDAKTIAESLKENGYYTQAFSYGLFVQPEWGFDQGFDGFSGAISTEEWDDIPRIFDEALLWLRQNQKQPFFLFLRPWQVHDPYTPSEKAIAAIGEKRAEVIRIRDIVAVNRKEGGATRGDIELFRTAYDAEIRELDDGIRDFFEGLNSLGLLENTVVIVTGDHGEEFGEHGTVGAHVGLYNEVIHVPLIFIIPSVRPARVAAIAELRAIPPTLLDILGLRKDTAFPAESLFSRSSTEKNIALSSSALDREYFLGVAEKAYAAFGQIGKSIFPKPRQKEWDEPYASSVRNAKWHLIKNESGEFELYNLEEDPNELNNLFPSWAAMNSEDRREVLQLFQAIGSDVPVPCGIYCVGSEE